MATNDTSENFFISLTRHMQNFGQVLGINASAIGHARINGDFKQSLHNSNKDCLYNQVPKNEKTIITLCIKHFSRGEEETLNVSLTCMLERICSCSGRIQ